MTTETDQVLLQRFLRVYGEIIGRHPLKWALVSLLVGLAIGIPGWCTRKPFGGSKPLLNPEELELQWSVDAGKTQRNIKLWHERIGIGDDAEWEQQWQTVMLLGKGDKEGNDVLTRDALLELNALNKK